MNGLSLLSGMTLAQAATPATPQGGFLQGVMGMAPIILIVVIMYFLMIRPQQKKAKAQQAMINSIKQGDEVVTTGGLYGTVAGVREKKNTLYLKIADNVKIEVERFAIARVLSDEEKAAKD